MKFVLFLSLQLMFGFSLFGQSNWKKFVTDYPAYNSYGVEINCGNYINYAFLNPNDGRDIFGERAATALYKVGKLSFSGGKTGMVYASTDGERTVFYLSIHSKKGKQEEVFTLGTTYSTGDTPDRFSIEKSGDGYLITKINSIGGEDQKETFTVKGDGTRAW
jgi:hypothetical protein